MDTDGGGFRLMVTSSGGMTTASLREGASGVAFEETFSGEIPISWGGCSCFGPPEPPRKGTVTGSAGLAGLVALMFLFRRRHR